MKSDKELWDQICRDWLKTQKPNAMPQEVDLVARKRELDRQAEELLERAPNRVAGEEGL